MTPAEKIIIRFYAANNFMINTRNTKSYELEKRQVYEDIQKALNLEVNLNYSVQQIREKWQYLCDIFITAKNKMDNKETLTYLENSLYHRLYFLRAFITPDNKLDSAKSLNLKNNAEVNETVSEEMLNLVDTCITNKENVVCQESASVLNEIIQSYKDKKIQRLCLQFILKSIQRYAMTCKN